MIMNMSMSKKINVMDHVRTKPDFRSWSKAKWSIYEEDKDDCCGAFDVACKLEYFVVCGFVF